MGPVERSVRAFYVEVNVGYANHPWTNNRTTTVSLENQLGDNGEFYMSYDYFKLLTFDVRRFSPNAH